MVFKGLLAATTAAVLVATPAVASAKTADLAPAVESVSGAKQMNSASWLIAALALLAVIGGVIAATSGGNEAPVSP